MSALFGKLRLRTPGLLAAAMVALVAAFLAQRYSFPLILLALLLGMALNFLGDSPRYRAGLDVAAKPLLRLGVALLGARISFGEIIDLGAYGCLIVGAAMCWRCDACDHRRLDPLGQSVRFSRLLRPAHWRSDSHLRRIRSARALRYASRRSAKGKSDSVHGRRGFCPVDLCHAGLPSADTSAWTGCAGNRRLPGSYDL